jgi:hypothetical protein
MSKVDTRRQIGIPYGTAEVDHKGYAVICPTCLKKSYGTGSNEDAATKSAGRKYATHYAQAHRDEL